MFWTTFRNLFLQVLNQFELYVILILYHYTKHENSQKITIQN